jgi:hypothetical protein
MATFVNVPGMNPSTVDFRLATIQIARGSTNELQEIVCLGDPNSSLGVAQILAAAPTSTAHGLVVRIAGGASTATDLAVRALLSSTGADNPVSIAVVSTTFASSAGFHFDSSGAMQVTMANGSAVDTDDNSVAGGQANVAVTISETYGFNGSTTWLRVEASTAAMAPGAAGLGVRQVLPTLNSTASADAFAASTSWVVATSNASVKTKVFAYSITTTCVTATNLKFYNGATMMWPVVLQAISSAVSGVNLAVSPPAFLFQNSTGAPMTLQTSGSSAGPAFHVAVSYFQEP